MNLASAAWRVLAEEETRRPSPSEAWMWLFGLTAGVIGAFIVAGVVIFIVRNRTLKEETRKTDVPLTLHDVRQMHARGEIDAMECERLKGIVMEQAKREKAAPPKPGQGQT